MTTAFEDGHRALYHWQRFDSARLAKTLAENVIYCASPSDFNDPWDCKPYYNVEILADEVERERYAEWAVDVCRRRTGMSENDIENTRRTLMTDVAKATTSLKQITASLVQTIAGRYRVYCLGPEPENLLMWSHYADSHRGICLEFDLRNEVMCGALRCNYLAGFPVMRLYDLGDDAELSILLSKAAQWSYEREYRIVAQERRHAISAGTLMTDCGYLKLPDAAIVSVIVGCQADQAAVEAVVRQTSPRLRIRRAVRLPNKYAIEIEG